MDINLTPEQAQHLLRLVYLGNWLANSQRVGSAEDPLIAEFDEVHRKLFSVAEIPERAIENDSLVVRAIDEYRDEVFWDELVERLAHRDFERLWNLCPDHDELSPEMEQEFAKLRLRYEGELEESGIDRLEMLRTVDDLFDDGFTGKDE